jgi:hypothetical protein
MPARARFLARLLAVLKPQLEDHPYVRVTTHVTNPHIDLGANRQNMIDAAEGDYINFIDDDDLVPAHYVKTIYPLLDGVDYIGFQLQLFTDGVKEKPTFHSLKHPEWNGDERGWYRDISHLNPMRAELVNRVRMHGGAGEDARWARDLRQLGVVKTEHYIDDVMYFYYWRSNKSDSDISIPNGTLPHVPIARIVCGKCGSSAVGIAGGLRHCNQCGHRWA